MTAQPLNNVFQRLPRLVRELAETLGKRVILIINDGDLVVDKTIIEQLAEPLIHILRNAIDHGIEATSHRQQLGKPLVGSIKLSASFTDKQLYIKIEDDGRGLNLKALARKAEAAGLKIDDDEILTNLIFRPGISTAKTVSEISGRGIGLDAVRHNLKMLGGDISVNSIAGQGTCFILSLPLRWQSSGSIVCSDLVTV